MKKAVSRRLVIDASVAFRAGGKNATHPDSKSCRDFLTAVYRICHHVVMTVDIKEEWDRYQSPFSRTWRFNMVQHRKLDSVRVDTGPPAVFAAAAFPAIQDSQLSSSQQEAVAKDIRLIEAAIATDSRVVSCDQEMRGLLLQMTDVLPQLCSIVWVDPTRDDEQAIKWLERGAPKEPHRRLSPIELR